MVEGHGAKQRAGKDDRGDDSSHPVPMVKTGNAGAAALQDGTDVLCTASSSFVYATAAQCSRSDTSAHPPLCSTCSSCQPPRVPWSIWIHQWHRRRCQQPRARQASRPFGSATDWLARSPLLTHSPSHHGSTRHSTYSSGTTSSPRPWPRRQFGARAACALLPPPSSARFTSALCVPPGRQAALPQTFAGHTVTRCTHPPLQAQGGGPTAEVRVSLPLEQGLERLSLWRCV